MGEEIHKTQSSKRQWRSVLRAHAYLFTGGVLYNGKSRDFENIMAWILGTSDSIYYEGNRLLIHFTHAWKTLLWRPQLSVMANLIHYFLHGVDRCSGAGAPMHVCVGCVLCVCVGGGFSIGSLWGRLLSLFDWDPTWIKIDFKINSYKCLQN